MAKKQDLKSLKESMRKRYDSIRSPMYCTCLNQRVYFNAKGFHHLLYNGLGKARSLDEAMTRLTLIPLIVPVVRNASDSTYEKRYVRRNRKKSSPNVLVEMWGIEAIVGQSPSKIRVVLKRREQEQIIFWSVMRLRKQKTP